MVSFKDYAKNNGVSYEAVCQQVARYRDEIGDHIVKKGKTQYLDEEAVSFLDNKRKENPIILLERKGIRNIFHCDCLKSQGIYAILFYGIHPSGQNRSPLAVRTASISYYSVNFNTFSAKQKPKQEDRKAGRHFSERISKNERAGKTRGTKQAFAGK